MIFLRISVSTIATISEPDQLTSKMKTDSSWNTRSEARKKPARERRRKSKLNSPSTAQLAIYDKTRCPNPRVYFASVFPFCFEHVLFFKKKKVFFSHQINYYIKCFETKKKCAAISCKQKISKAVAFESVVFVRLCECICESKVIVLLQHCGHKHQFVLLYHHHHHHFFPFCSTFAFNVNCYLFIHRTFAFFSISTLAYWVNHLLLLAYFTRIIYLLACFSRFFPIRFFIYWPYVRVMMLVL